MKRLLCKLVLLASVGLACLFPSDAYATHFAGSELTYRWLGGNQYQIQLVVYRDCGGIPISSSFNIEHNSCAGSGNWTLNKIQGPVQQIVPYCPGTTTSCDPSGAAIGIEKHIYQADVTLQNCPDWVFSWNGSARNSATNTLSQGTMYVEATLDNSVNQNSSPQFNTNPVALMCVNRDFIFSQGAIDADGDQLSYALVQPLNSPTIPVPYAAGFSFSNPLTSSSPLSLDPSTGAIEIYPSQLETSVMAVQVTETRNGVVIGTIVRDMYLIVIDCANDAPFTTGINGTNTFTFSGNYSQPVNFTVPSGDPNGDQVTMTWDQGIPGASFSISGGNNPTGTFSWTPGPNDGGTYVFQVTVTDDGCPLPLTTVYTFIIEICQACISEVYYENRGANGLYGLLPPRTLSQSFIKAGESVTPGLNDGPVRVEANQNVEFIASTQVLLEPGFVAIGNFLAKIDPSDCPQECQVPPLVLNIDIDTTCNGYEIIPTAAGGIGPYAYTVGFNNVPFTPPLSLSPNSTQNIPLTVQDGIGGFATTTITLSPTSWMTGNPVAFFASAFTPNGDGINDVWVVAGLGGTPPTPYNAHTYLLRIFNQWGNLIYEISRTDFNGLTQGEIQWDGVANVPPFTGQGPIEGTYTYTSSITNCTTTFNRAGTINAYTFAPENTDTPNARISTAKPESATQFKIYPNPVRSFAQLEFQLADAGSVQVRLHDIRGKVVRTLLNDQWMEAGTHLLDFQTEELAGGTYLCSLVSENYTKTIRLVIQ